MGRFVTIKTADFPHELIVLKTYLESEGIDCYIKDELTSQINAFYSRAIGGAKLQVDENDLGNAVDILRTTDFKLDADLDAAGPDEGKNLNSTSGYKVILIIVVASIAFAALLTYLLLP